LRLTDASLAYLSACETTVTTPGLADEAVHITGAFHLAGYRHVIGTLWPIYDDLARVLDIEVYRHLTAQATTPPQTASTAQILHHAIRALRDELADGPAEWAAHIHVGS
jgi:CHAT domain-containing protein